MVDLMPDMGFEHPRLVGLYDVLNGDRDDLVAYLDIVEQVGAGRVADLGCGTGTFALLLADRGGQTLTSDSTLRFRERDEVQSELVMHGYAVDEVRGAPDRPGRELVFLARRPRSAR